MNDNNIKIKKLEEQLTQIHEQNRNLEKQLSNSQQNSPQIENIKKNFKF